MDTVEATEVRCYRGDIPGEYLALARNARVVAWDIETSGLDWRTDKIGTCQLYIPGIAPVLVIIGNDLPHNLGTLVSEASIMKVFHHAMFDLRFMTYRWGVQAQNIACTKIAAKLINREDNSKNSLKLLLGHYLHVSIDKTSQKSDWLAPQLSDAQIQYAVKDVLYLIELLSALEQDLGRCGLLELAHKCFAHIPTQVALEVMGYKDIYAY
jgi:ribonuclease D